MHSIVWKLLFVCSMFDLIRAGVKIEITRVKDPPTSVTILPNGAADNNDIGKTETTETTTIPTTITTTVETTTKLTTESHVQRLTISTLNPLNSSAETSTIAPNVTGMLRPTQANNTNTNTNTNASSLYNTTFVAANELNPYLSEFTRRQMRRRLIPADYYCPCDLKINFCDINCCCDVDCASREIIQTLKCNERDWSIHDYEDSSELQLCSQTRQFSLFCIVDNTRKRKQMRKRDFKVHEVNILSVVQYKWPNQYDYQAFMKNDYREQYTFGDPILTWDDANEEIKFLDVPWSFGASNCHIKTPIKHLMDDEIKCVQTLEEHDQFIADFQNKLKIVKILKNRKPLDTPTIIMKDFCLSAQWANQTDNCTVTEIYHCADTISMRTCKLENNLTASFAFEFGENFLSDQLSIQIHHNFTHILNVTVFFVYHEFNTDNPMTHVVQKISVEYLELNETFATRDAHQVSGNIGYLQHKPLIFTKFIRLNETKPDNNVIAINGFLAYFHNETNCTNDEHHMKMPAIEMNGDCVINNFTFQTINFGENARVKCNAVLTPNEFNETDTAEQPFIKAEQNNTHICRNFQKRIFEYLLHGFELEDVNSTIFSRFVNRISEMGNPRNDTEHWRDFSTVHSPNFNEIIATGPTNAASEFTCTNMVLGVRYEFFYGTTIVGKVSNQALIKVAQIQFGNRVNLKFKFDDDVLKVPLYIDVMFFDFSRVVGNAAPNRGQIQFHILILVGVAVLVFN